MPQPSADFDTLRCTHTQAVEALQHANRCDVRPNRTLRTLTAWARFSTEFDPISLSLAASLVNDSAYFADAAHAAAVDAEQMRRALYSL